MSSPLVIAHRGASGYRPENTVAAFRLGLDMQADGIEFDLVTTKDERLIVRHENTLSSSTNIASMPVFQSAKRLGRVDNKDVRDWFTEDFNLSDLAQVKAIERLGELRPGSAKFDSQFEIPTFQELLNDQQITNHLVVAELKIGSHLTKLSRPVWEIFVSDLMTAPLVENLVVESFDLKILRGTKRALQQQQIQARYFFLLEEGAVEDHLIHIREFDGISISLEMLFADLSWVEKTHQLGKQIWVYTARAEQASTSIEEYYLKIVDTGVDGIFADQPDLLRRVLADNRGSAYDY